jgi:hypothetical protein
MRKRRILLAIVFGSMLAVTGCGDDDGNGGGSGGTGGMGGTGGSGGGSGGDFCMTLCGACGGDQVAECTSACDSYTQDLPGFIDIDSCPDEADAWGECLGANSCDSQACETEINDWATCVVAL